MAQTLEEINLRKLRGGYYTPAEVSDMLAQWAIHAPQNTILKQDRISRKLDGFSIAALT